MVPLPNPTGCCRPYLAKVMMISNRALLASRAVSSSASRYMSRATLALTCAAPRRSSLVSGAGSGPVPIVHSKSMLSAPRSLSLRGSTPPSAMEICGNAWMSGWVWFLGAVALAILKGYSHVKLKSGVVDAVGYVPFWFLVMVVHSVEPAAGRISLEFTAG